MTDLTSNSKDMPGDALMPEPSEPINETPSEPLVITGEVMDIRTSNYVLGAQVSLCKVNAPDSLEIIDTVLVARNGSYYFQIDKANISTDIDFKLLVYQWGKQVQMGEDSVIPYSDLASLPLIKKDLLVYRMSTVKGKLLRKDGRPASNCLVEVFVQGDSGTEFSGYTNKYGEYEIPYEVPSGLNPTRNIVWLQLKYFNNEDIIPPKDGTQIETTLPTDEFKISPTTLDSSIQLTVGINVSEYHAVYDIKTEVINQGTENELVLYYLITGSTKNGEDWDIDMELKYIKDEAKETKNYYRVLSNGNAVIEKRIEFAGDRRIEYMKIPADSQGQKLEVDDPNIKLNAAQILRRDDFDGEDIENTNPEGKDFNYTTNEDNSYLKEELLYNDSISPVVYRQGTETTVNFKFTKRIVYLYTKITSTET